MLITAHWAADHTFDRQSRFFTEHMPRGASGIQEMALQFFLVLCYPAQQFTFAVIVSHKSNVFVRCHSAGGFFHGYIS
ncbi:Uncharacterised protein [Vibrio cholerae]|nr:Uncharacterised protein [Vibrio cholerae]